MIQIDQESLRLLADVLHLWIDGYIEKNRDSCAPEEISTAKFAEIERFLGERGIEVDYLGWHKVESGTTPETLGLSDAVALKAKPTRRQIVFNWLQCDDLTNTSGWWGGSDDVKRIDELLAALDLPLYATDRQWTDEMARLLDLYLRDYKPTDVARVLVEKYRELPGNVGRDIFDSNPAYKDGELLGDVKLPEVDITPEDERLGYREFHREITSTSNNLRNHRVIACRERQLLTALKDNARLAELRGLDIDAEVRAIQRAQNAEAELANLVEILCKDCMTFLRDCHTDVAPVHANLKVGVIMLYNHTVKVEVLDIVLSEIGMIKVRRLYDNETTWVYPRNLEVTE